MTDSDRASAPELRKLIEQWREAGGWQASEMSNRQYADALDQCADELEALLSASAPVRASGEPQELLKRVRDYLGNGGLFNPELMDANKVRELVMDLAAALSSPPAQESSLITAITKLRDSYFEQIDPVDLKRPEYVYTQFVRELDALLALSSSPVANSQTPHLVVERIVQPVARYGQPQSEAFEAWWAREGMFIDPDTSDVPWFDKRKELCGLAFIAATAQSANYTADRETEPTSVTFANGRIVRLSAPSASSPARNESTTTKI